MFEITKKDARKFRELPLVVEEGITYYYDFTIMDRYVVFHSKSDIFVQYEMYDKVSHIQHKILKNLCWIEVDGGTDSALLSCVPANVSELICKDLWQTPNTHWVLTSGTICDDSGFSYFKSELGMDKDISERILRKIR